MKFRIILTLILSFNTKSYGYNLAKNAKTILKEFETSKIRSNFGKELYSEVKKVTSNFTKNLTFEYLEQYLDLHYLDFLAKTAAKNNPNTHIALVWPVTVNHDRLINKIFNKYCNIIYSKRILLNQKEARNLLSQIPDKAKHPQGVNLWFQEPYTSYNPMRVYLIECKKNNTDYKQMKIYLTKIFSNNENYINSFEKKYGEKAIENLYTITICKREIRKAVNLEYAMHIEDTHKETMSLANILFNENSLDCLRYSNPDKLKTLSKYKKFTNLFKTKFTNNINNIIVYNSAVLSAYGLRDCNDIDFLHDPRISIPHNPHPDLSNQNKYFKKNYVILEKWNGKHYILEDCPNALNGINLDTSNLFKIKISIDELLYNPKYYFYFHGIKYATIDFMHYFKKKRGRSKDLNDVLLIENHFKNRN